MGHKPSSVASPRAQAAAGRVFLGLLLPGLLLLLLLASAGCAHKKFKERLTQKSLRSKIVALAEINGAKDARFQTEVAVVNEIIEKGRFQIVDRATLQNALVKHPTEADWQALAQELGADLILAIDIIEFKVDTKTGYDSAEEEDSLLSSENRRSRDTKWKNYYKVKAHEGYVKIKLKFFDVVANQMQQTEYSQASRTYNSRDGDLPRKMKILEQLTSQAVTAYFDAMPE